MPRLYDTFIFFNELDLLELRLTELDDSPVYRHVIVESTTTFQGKPKPLHLLDHQERFAPWHDRMTYVIAEIGGEGGPWEREAASREAIWQGLKDAEPDDVVLLSDADEIPRVPVLGHLQCPVTLLMDHHMFAVDWRHPDLIAGTTAMPLAGITSFEAARRGRRDRPLLANTGWHFSWLGGVGMVKEKAHAFSHTEMTDAICQHADGGLLYQQGRAWAEWRTGSRLPDPGTLDVQLEPVDVDETFPRWIREGKCPEGWFRPREPA